MMGQVSQVILPLEGEILCRGLALQTEELIPQLDQHLAENGQLCLGRLAELLEEPDECPDAGLRAGCQEEKQEGRLKCLECQKVGPGAGGQDVRLECLEGGQVEVHLIVLENSLTHSRFLALFFEAFQVYLGNQGHQEHHAGVRSLESHT